MENFVDEQDAKFKYTLLLENISKQINPTVIKKDGTVGNSEYV